MGSWPENVGILAMELYFPSQYVEQTELEQFDGVSAGKYTIGLGQKQMGFCSDREDINSLCLTVVQNLLDNNGIRPSDIGRLEVGTETIIDKSKSVKTVLMQLFEPHGVTDIEGIDTTNACFGGTAALFNSVAWVESSLWNGRYALVVAADIAIYAKSAARPTGGAGAIAMLVGPNAPLVIDRGLRGFYCRHVYDFYKPDLTSEYPVVDGKLSIQCYLSALDKCYKLYTHSVKKRVNQDINLNYFHAILFHTPFCKLVQKSLARLAVNDYVNVPEGARAVKYPDLDKKFPNIKLEESYFDREIESAFLAYSKDLFEEKTKPSLLVANLVGNMYTPSLYGGLVSFLVSKDVSQLAGAKVGLFSYGSGLASLFFSITITADVKNKDLNKLVSNLKLIISLLDQRAKAAPQEFDKIMEERKESLHKAPYEPLGNTDTFFPGTYYLTKIDEAYRRFYDRVPTSINNHE
ncbi:hydroxymethylglutaryl-CoA synthase 1 [Cylas formicarius]|nr:hydroxymethylglutaryl-CoA synthase 1 [Cylas formicarius]